MSEPKFQELFVTEDELEDLHELLSIGRDLSAGKPEHERFNHWMETVKAHLHVLRDGK